MNEIGLNVFKRKAKSLLILFSVLMGILLCFMLVGCGGENSTENETNNNEAAAEYADLESVNLLLASGAPVDNIGDVWQKSIAENVSEITGGKLTIEYHGNSELGGDADIFRQLQSGDIQMVAAQPSSVVPYVGEAGCFDLPMAFVGYDAETIDAVLNGDNEFTQALDSAYEENGFVNLGFVQDATFRITTSNVPLNTLEDYKGLQIRTMQSANAIAFWEALGAAPTPLDFSEVYISLQNGTIDAQEKPTDTIVGSSIQEVQKYYENTNHTLSTYNMVMNKEAWDSLDPKYQEALVEAIAMATEETMATQPDREAAATQTMKDAGMQEIVYDDSFYEEVLNLDGVKKIYSDISAQTNGLSDQMVEALETEAANRS